MALVGGDVRFYYTVNAALGTNQADPNQSLGGNRAGNTIETVQSALSAVMLNRFEFVDASRIGLPPTLPAYVAFVQGVNALQMRRIVAFDTVTGTFTVDFPFVGLAGIGDVYRYSELGHLFDAVDREEASGGIPTYRAIVARNQTGVAINAGVYHWAFDGWDRGIPFDVGASANLTSIGLNIPTIANDRVEPDLSDTGFDSAGTAVFWRAHSRLSSQSPQIPVASWANNNDEYLWLQRRTLDLSRQSVVSAALLILTLTTVAGDPDPLTTCVPLVWAQDGIVPEVLTSFDRKPRTFGGLVVTSLCRDDFGLLPIEDESIEHTITAGPGSLVQDPLAVTDADGILRVVYLSPENEANAGDTVTIEAEVT